MYLVYMVAYSIFFNRGGIYFAYFQCSGVGCVIKKYMAYLIDINLFIYYLIFVLICQWEIFVCLFFSEWVNGLDTN